MPYQSHPFGRGAMKTPAELPQPLEMRTIVNQVRQCPELTLRKCFLAELLKYDHSKTLQPFITAGFNIEEPFGRHQPTPGTWLSYAARRQKPQNVRVLLAAGADPVLAISALLQHHSCWDGVSQDVYGQLLSGIDSTKQPLIVDLDRNSDPFHILYCFEKVRAIDPNSLLSRGLYRRKSMHGAEDCLVSRSYMFQAIWRNKSHLVEALLRHGVSIQQSIGDMFDCDGSRQDLPPRLLQPDARIGLHSWLTFAVDHGSIACANTLIRYGADITARNGLGRNALQVAQLNLQQDHPRVSTCGIPMCALCKRKGLRDKGFITLKKDLETFDMLGSWAAQHSLQPSILLDGREFPSQTTTDQVVSTTLNMDSGEFTELLSPYKALLINLARPPSKLSLILKALNMLRFRVDKMTKSSWWSGCRNLWHMSSLETLLLRLGYIFFYSLLICFETSNLVCRLTSFRRPPTSVTLLGLALVFGWCAYRT